MIGDVRGLGLMIGVEFTNPDGTPGSQISDSVKKHCLENNLLLLQCGTYHQVIRWIPPLVVNEEQIHTGLEIFERAVAVA
jgi:4-aminobutyrate aminotransferase-like enzyme